MSVICNENHQYFEEGNRVPGFTEIVMALGIVKPNPFYTPDGRDQGTALHQWLLFLAQGKEPADLPDERIAGRVEGIRKFLRESDFKFQGGEQPMFDKSIRFCCTPDLWGNMAGARCVIDAKRGAKLKHHALQTAAQKLALASNGIHCRDRYTLYLKDGGYKLEQHTDANDMGRWQAIVAAYHAAQFYNTQEKK